jgi:hypothetical protein
LVPALSLSPELVVSGNLEEYAQAFPSLGTRCGLRTTLGGGWGRVTLRPRRLPDARRPELAHGLPRYGFWVSLCFRELGDCGCSTARARRGFVLGVTPEARRTTTARVPGDRDPGIPAEAALADPTGTGEFRPYRGLRPTHRRRSLTSLPKQTRAPLHDPARCRLPFGH